jgi:hypothetical protein
MDRWRKKEARHNPWLGAEGVHFLAIGDVRRPGSFIFLQQTMDRGGSW